MKNKILSILYIFILISLFLLTNVFAFDVTDKNGTLHTLPDLPNGEPFTYVYVITEDDYHVLNASYVDGSYFKITSENDSVYSLACFDSSGNQIEFTYFGRAEVDNGWYETLNVSGGGVPYYSYTNGLYAGTLYNTDGTLFFQQPPAPKTLAVILGGTSMMGPTMKEILTLVPIMIILIVSYLALRKGLTFIKTLRKM